MSSKLNIKNYVVYGDNTEKLSPAFVHLQQMSVTSQLHQWNIKPHRHSNLLQIYIITKGEFTFISEEKRFKFDKPYIIIIPENVIHGLKQSKDIEGTVLSISYPLLEELLTYYPKGLNDFEQLHLIECGKNNDKQTYESIVKMIQVIDNEQIKNNIGKDTMIRSILSQLLINILRLGQNKQNQIASNAKNSLNHRHFKAFQDLIKQQNKVLNNVKEYARELNMTDIHLNRISKTISGKTALQVIQEYKILEAKRYLKYSSFTVAEIAHILNFREPSYFSRFFKKMTDLTPKDFRNQ